MGTPINTLIEAAGGIPENTGKIIGGGPMMGKALVSAEVPVTKGSSGVLLLTKEESVRKPMQDCIRCAKCVNVCPMGLNPAFLMKFTIYKDWEKAEGRLHPGLYRMRFMQLYLPCPPSAVRPDPIG